MNKDSYKPSVYNFFISTGDGRRLAFNSFSNSLAQVSEGKYKLISDILSNPCDLSFYTDEMKGLRDDLIKGSFLVEDDFDEIGYLKMRNKMGRFSGDYLGLTIAPTLACNFQCSYCFEEKNQLSMDEATENALVHFVEHRIEKVKELSVSWFGGEPTLKMDVIERLTDAFEKMCEAYKVRFPERGIITNGYLLNREMALRLKALKITSVQITLDGPPEIHDQRRPLFGGQGTFKRILNNILESGDIIRIHIRVNVDRQNASFIQSLLDLLNNPEWSGKISVYFGQVRSNTAACADMSSVCFNNEEHSRWVAEILKKPKNRSIVHVRYPSAQHFGFCTADRINGLVIAPNGSIFKCWCELGSDEKKSVGNIFDSSATSYQLNNLAGYLNWNHFDNPDCLACKLLPVCSGGCPYNAMHSPEKKDCSEFKYNLEEMLLLNYAKLKPK